MVHVRFAGRSFDFSEGQVGLRLGMSDQEIKERLAARLDVRFDQLKDYVVDRTINGDVIVRPEAVYG